MPIPTFPLASTVKPDPAVLLLCARKMVPVVAAPVAIPVAHVPIQRPFTPARGGTGGSAQAQANEWAELAAPDE